MLKERYGDAQTVINSHYAELINLKTAPNTARGPRSLYDQIEKHPISLEVLEQNINQYIFVSMITSKIPKDVLIQLEIQKGARNKWIVKELRKLFNNYVAARERAEQQFSAGKMEATGNSNESIVNSAEALMVVAQAVGDKVEKKKFSTKCRFCDALHWCDECTKYTSSKTMKQTIKDSFTSV